MDTARTTPINGAHGASLSARLDTVREMSGLDTMAVQRLGEFLTSASDEQLFRTNPLRFAALTGLPEQTAIDLFLYATHTGILGFDWGVLCPHCGSFITTPGGLRALDGHARCSLCQMDSPVSVDDAVEVAFTVSPAVRKIRFHDETQIDFAREWPLVFYSTSRVLDPRAKTIFDRLMVKHLWLNEGQTGHLETPLEPGRYLIVAPRHHTTGYLTVAEGETAHQAHLDLFDGRIVPEESRLAPGTVRLDIRNRTGRRAVVGLIHQPMEMMIALKEEFMAAGKAPFSMLPYLSGKRLVTTQSFRDLFRAESIPSELGLSFKSLTFLFTDLKGSTALYDRIGDLRAYQLVRRHFGLLRDIIAETGGAVVKTMGDAVMASFAEPGPALEAAILMNREIGNLGGDEEAAQLALKIGLHTGPCVAIESNERLDYFGQTVNIASRVQEIARAGEIVLTDPVYQGDRSQAAIRSAKLQINPDRAALRGIGGEVGLYRLN